MINESDPGRHNLNGAKENSFAHAAINWFSDIRVDFGHYNKRSYESGLPYSGKVNFEKLYNKTWNYLISNKIAIYDMELRRMNTLMLH